MPIQRTSDEQIEGTQQPSILSASKPQIAILTNMISPYRAPLYDCLSDHFDVTVLVSQPEDNRKWGLFSSNRRFRVERVGGWNLKWRTRRSLHNVHDLRYTHINPHYLMKLWRLHPAAIISNEMGVRSAIAIIYGMVCSVPVWIWWGGTLHTERQRSTVKRLLRRHVFARVVPRWISYGVSSTEYLLSLGISSDRILEIQNCVDEQMFTRDADTFPLDAPRPRALCVSQLIGRKGIRELLHATARLQDEGISFSLVIVGSGPEERSLKADARRLGVRNAYWIPHVSPEQMASVYRSCDFLVFPTLEDVWGLVVNEALLSGIPVISSKYAGCATELIPAESIFDPLDVADFLRLYRRAVEGGLPRPDTAAVKPVREVADMIADDLAERM